MTPPGAGNLLRSERISTRGTSVTGEKEVDEIVWDPLEHPDLGRPRQIAGDALCGDLAVPPPARGGAVHLVELGPGKGGIDLRWRW